MHSTFHKRTIKTHVCCVSAVLLAPSKERDGMNCKWPDKRNHAVTWVSMFSCSTEKR